MDLLEFTSFILIKLAWEYSISSRSVFFWFIDLFTLGNQVDTYNALFGRQFNANNNHNVNNIVVNVPGHSPNNSLNMSEHLHKLHELKEKGILTEEEYNIQKAKVLA